MADFIFKGTIRLRGVDFVIKASTLEEAKELARKGEFYEYHAEGAETSDWEIFPNTGERTE